MTSSIPENIRKHCNNGYWSTNYLRTYIKKVLSQDGSIGDIIKIDINDYKQGKGKSDRIPIKIRAWDNGTFLPLKLYGKNDTHSGSATNEEYRTGRVKIAKYINPKLFKMDGDKYTIRPDAKPTDEDTSATFYVIEQVQAYVEAEFARLIEEGTIALPSTKSKKKDKDLPAAKVVLRNKNDSLVVPIIYETKSGEEIVNPTALFKFQKDDETGIFKFDRGEDVSPDADKRELVLTADNITKMIPTKTKLNRILLTMNGINIYAGGVSIVAYVDGLKITRPENRKNVEFSDSEADDEGDDADADVDFE